MAERGSELSETSVQYEERDEERSSHCITTGDSNETSTKLNNCLSEDVNNTQLDDPCVREALSPVIGLPSSSAAMEADSSLISLGQ